MSKATITQPDRELPCNIDSERVVLGNLIEDGTLLSGILESGLKASDFSLSDHQRIFQAILDLRQQGAPVDHVTLAEQLGQQAEDIALIMALIYGCVVESKHAIYHARLVKRKAALRELLRQGEWLQTAAAEVGADPELVISAAIGKLQEVRL